MAVVRSVNLAVVRTDSWTRRKGSSGIDKRPVSGTVRLTSAGVEGDTVVDRVNHGDWCQAAYVFDVEELAHWSGELGRELVPGNAGENLTVEGLDSSDRVIGQRLRIGTAVVRVTGPRVPCQVFAGFWGVRGLVKRFTEHGRTGTYLAVEEPGEVRAGDVVEVLSTPEHWVTVAELFAVTQRRRHDLVEHVMRCFDDLPERWVTEARQRIALLTASSRS